MTENDIDIDIDTNAAPAAVQAVLTTFNRRDTTLACLERLHAAAREAGAALGVIVVDDASTDGTAAAVRERFPDALVIDGPGDLYWNRGMHVGIAAAMRLPSWSHLLWLNDDTQLRPDALARLLAQSRALARRHQGRPVLLAGATADASGRLSYGGAVSPGRLRRFTYRKVWDAEAPRPCEAINGNCVLVPRALAEAVGNLDPAFEHAMGDTDYALRARRAGFAVYVAGGIVGECGNNPTAGTFHDASLGLARRWKKMLHRKGLPWRSWLHFTRRHGGAIWPLYFAWPYARLLLSGLRRRGAGRAAT